MIEFFKGLFAEPTPTDELNGIENQVWAHRRALQAHLKTVDTLVADHIKSANEQSAALSEEIGRIQSRKGAVFAHGQDLKAVITIPITPNEEQAQNAN